MLFHYNQVIYHSVVIWKNLDYFPHNRTVEFANIAKRFAVCNLSLSRWGYTRPKTVKVYFYFYAWVERLLFYSKERRHSCVCICALASFVLCVVRWPGAYSYHRRYMELRLKSRTHTVQRAYSTLVLDAIITLLNRPIQTKCVALITNSGLWLETAMAPTVNRGWQLFTNGKYCKSFIKLFHITRRRRLVFQLNNCVFPKDLTQYLSGYNPLIEQTIHVWLVGDIWAWVSMD